MAKIGVQIELEGAPQYKENMANLTAQTKLYQAQLKRLDAEMSSGASAFQKSITQSKALQQQLEAQTNQSKLLEEQIAKATEQYGEDSTQVIRLKTQYENLQAAIAKTNKALEENGGLAGAIGAQFQEVGNKLSAVGDKMTSIGTSLSTKVTAPILGIGTAAVKTAADFDSSMSQVGATMGFTVGELNDSTSEASKTMGQLSEFAQEMGKTTAFSASEAAEALNYMALAGYDAETSMKMLPTVLDLAAAGGIGLAEASDMVTDAQSALGLSLEETSKMVDEMAKASSKSNTSVAQLGEAMLTIGATASNVSGGTTELATTLGVLADNGIKGAEGGTHLRNMILSLQSAAKDGAVDFGAFSVQVYDSEGNFRAVSDIMQEVSSNMNGMSQESKDAITSGIFNKTDLASVNALLNTSAGRFSELKTEIEGAEGAASDMAAVQLNNLEGQTKLLKSALEGLAIQIGSILMPYIMKFVEKIQSVVEWFSNLDSGTQEMIVKIAAIAAAIGPLLVVGGKLTSGIGSMVENVGKLIAKVGPLMASIGATAPLILGIVAAIGALIAIFVTLYKNNEDFRDAVQGAWQKISEFISSTCEQIKAIFSSFMELISAIWTKYGDEIMLYVSTVFEVIKTVINTAMTVIKAIIDTIIAVINGDWKTAWENIKLIFSTVWNGIKSIVSTIFSTVVTIIQNKIQQIIAKFTSMKNSVVSVFTNLINSALSWGKDFVQGFVDGITAKMQALIDKVKSMAETVKSYLHFSEPDKGPLKDFNSWPRDMVEQYAAGIESARYLIKDAVSDVAADVAVLANPLSADDMYSAIRAGASDATLKLSIGDREFSRSLRDMGVAFNG